MDRGFGRSDLAGLTTVGLRERGVKGGGIFDFEGKMGSITKPGGGVDAPSKDNRMEVCRHGKFTLP
jgi:hypothetical protein